MKNKVLVFGASIVHGSSDEQGGWVQRLSKFLERDCSVYNLGISGNTSEDILKRFKSEAKIRIFNQQNVILLFSFGLNDSQYLNDKQRMRISSQRFKKNLVKLFKMAKGFSNKIFFIGLTPINDSNLDPIPWFNSASYKSKYVEKYNGIIKKVCEDKNVVFVDIKDELDKLGYKTTLIDGVHPNAQGHQMIFEAVKNIFNK